MEASSPNGKMSRRLAPVVHKLKWALQRDKLSKMVRMKFCNGVDGTVGLGNWLERQGYGLVEESEKVRLAICPDIRKIIGFYEGLSK